MDDEHDADAGAEGEMEFEENGELPSGSMASASRKAVEMERKHHWSEYLHTLPWFRPNDGTDNQELYSSSSNNLDWASFPPRRVHVIDASDLDSILTVTCAQRKGILASKFRANSSQGWPRICSFIRRNDISSLGTCIHVFHNHL